MSTIRHTEWDQSCSEFKTKTFPYFNCKTTQLLLNASKIKPGRTTDDGTCFVVYAAAFRIRMAPRTQP